MLGSRRTAPRTADYARREAFRLEQKRRSDAEKHQRFGRPIIGIDAYGKPLGYGEVSSEDVVWSDVAVGLQRAANATGDPAFTDALAALKAYGLDGGSPKRSYNKVRSAVFGDDDRGYLENMKHLLEYEARNYSSITAAAEGIASSYFYDADSFDAAVQRLRKLYAAWQREGFPDQPLDWHQGDLGYAVVVRPVEHVRVPLPATRVTGFLEDGGRKVPYTNYWRHRFRDGDVWLSRSVKPG